ncbi:hypothetical protein, partial [Mycolicibacterium rhodesiae]|uniref:hypothetical protein n=1 Tax=Mycolicibacterium rhodesiae TaxID=36814 RepID=UPI0021F2C616
GFCRALDAEPAEAFLVDDAAARAAAAAVDSVPAGLATAARPAPAASAAGVTAAAVLTRSR